MRSSSDASPSLPVFESNGGKHSLGITLSDDDRDPNEELWVCNASADAKLYGFEPVDMPVNDFESVELRFA